MQLELCFILLMATTLPAPRNAPPRFRLGKLDIHALAFDEAIDRIITLAKTSRGAYVVTPNADHVVRAESDSSFVALCAGADLVLADGMPVVWAGRLMGQPVEKISGSDLTPRLCAAAARAGTSVFLMGGMPGDAEGAAARLRHEHPALQIAGTYCPPFGFEHDQAECEKIVAMINASGARILFVGVGSPKQEAWIGRHRDQLACGVSIGVGITISFLAGTTRRAPKFMQRTGTEWIYRLLQEPGRLAGRYARDFAIIPIALRSILASRR
jgi:N-acetylglucosaminyldiphosphoundecaprenol N-acetyl-beta-D-mannosaminyltransferase